MSGKRRTRRPLDTKMFALIIDRAALPQSPHDLQKFAGALVPFILGQKIAVSPLFMGFASDHHVEQQPAVRIILICRGHLGSESRRNQSGTECHQKCQTLRNFGQHGCRQPSILAPCPGGRQGADEAQLFGAPGDLTEIARGRGAGAPGRAGGKAMSTADDVAAIAIGGQKPVEGECHALVPELFRGIHAMLPIDHMG